MSREGVVREVEATLCFDLRTAQAVHQWLGEKIEELKRTLEAIAAMMQQQQQQAESATKDRKRGVKKAKKTARRTRK